VTPVPPFEHAVPGKELCEEKVLFISAKADLSGEKVM
jgi:hypothetical protein